MFSKIRSSYEKVAGLLRWLLFWPTIVSALLLLTPERLYAVVYASTMIVAFVLAGLGGPFVKNVTGHWTEAYMQLAGLVITFLAGMTLAASNLKAIHPTVMVTFLTGISVSSLMLIQKIRSIWKRHRLAEIEAKRKAKQERNDEIKAKLKVLVGSDPLVDGFLLALERLTRYVPDMARELLDAVLVDLNMYHIFVANAGSTKNEVLAKRSEQKAAAIKAAAQELCAKLTTEALETIHIHESMEADRSLNEDARPHMVEAGEKFQHYLEALREATDVGRDQNLVQQIAALEPRPEVEVTELPVAPVEKSRRLSGGRVTDIG